ncbi:hypothetical protein A0J57_05620 [Sphingobium sp. 22B]|nr:hypothetical protein AXW74_01935 [Sphingobium sp. AM]KYC33205.1 hypothetical protein A0J57_05620 [Sphingobium sp. 22B]OAP32391.1 hypothetical protein A8O16_07735 [Sphingobium sp. 20006FA]
MIRAADQNSLIKSRAATPCHLRLREGEIAGLPFAFGLTRNRVRNWPHGDHPFARPGHAQIQRGVVREVGIGTPSGSDHFRMLGGSASADPTGGIGCDEAFGVHGWRS